VMKPHFLMECQQGNENDILPLSTAIPDITYIVRPIILRPIWLT
jgi:hypothetical protein